MRISALFLFVITCLQLHAQQVKIGTLNRKAIVTRNNVVINSQDMRSPIQVGNGEFAFGADVTGLQTFIPFNTMSHWGWHSFPMPAGMSAKDFQGVNLNTHGRIVNYDIGNDNQPELSKWLAENPHALNLGRIGFRLKKSDGKEAQLADIKNVVQSLDLWQGIVTSSFELEGVAVKVTTASHGDLDAIAVHVESALIKQGRIAVFLNFPYGNALDSSAADYNKPDRHQTKLTLQRSQKATFERQLDSDHYNVFMNWAEKGTLSEIEKHQFLFSPDPANKTLEFVCMFSPTAPEERFPAFDQVIASSKSHWESFWKSGGAIDFSGSKDPRWKELERKIVLSQYVMAVNEAGSLPPQESGLVNSGWMGKFHYEMYWWHAAHYASWNRWSELNKSIGVYKNNLQSSKLRAKNQGYTGARWPKCTGPDGREWPHPIHALLIWQQPHPIFFAEMEYRYAPTKVTLEKWKDNVFETASFMSSYAYYDSTKKEYILGPPLYLSGENTDPMTTQNPVFELSYWRFGLRTAQAWRERLGMKREQDWDKVLNRLSPLPQQDGVYVLHEGIKDMWTQYNWEHPSVIGMFGMLPGDGVDTTVMNRTYDKLEKTWQFDRTWGWDFPWIAMSAARLGKPENAVNMLLHKNLALNKHGLPESGIFPYFPANGALLYAVAMMTAGWEGTSGAAQSPGFPKDGSWTIKWEGLNPAL